MLNDQYAAGLFDGEGYVRIDRWHKPNSVHIRYQLKSGIGMTHRPIIEALQAKYGGSIHANRHDLRNSKNRIQFCWTASSRIGASFLRSIRPYLIVKADEVDIALELQEGIDANPYTPAGRNRGLRWIGEEAMAHREVLFQRITALKKRSFPPLLIDGPKVSEQSLTR